MKKLIFTLLISLTVMSCGAQDLKVSETLGHAIGRVTQVTNDNISTVHTSSRTLEVDGFLEKDKEYNLIYLITDCGGCNIMKVKLIRAEYSAQQNGRNISEMMREYTIRNSKNEDK